MQIDRDQLNSFIRAREILTNNVRDGVSDPWRDYQQLLPELGLAVSTRYTADKFQLTDLGKKLLAGEVEFVDALAIQALRYQYPNGQKVDVPVATKRKLKDAGIAIPESLATFQASNSISIRPGALIARALLGLQDAGSEASLTVEEIGSALLPRKHENEASLAIAELIEDRARGTLRRKVEKHERRNIGDWLRFLTAGELFNYDEKRLSLTDKVTDHPTPLRLFLDETVGDLWSPTSDESPSLADWFLHFGELPPASIELLRYRTSTYVISSAEEFTSGLETPARYGGLDRKGGYGSPGLQSPQLREIDTTKDFSESTRQVVESALTDKELAESQRRAIITRATKSALHEALVRKIARALLATGATVEEDPNSIDIFARWNSRKLIIEAKTVELESLVPTLRFAVGQVLEYTFRSGYSREEVDLAIAVDHLIAEDHWSIEWLTEFLGVGLICCAANSSRVYLPSQIHCDEWNIEY